MKDWWNRRSLKLRLTLWYSITAIVISLALAAFVYEVVEHRLEAELDRQLRIDFDLVEAQLEFDPSGKMIWLVQGADGDEGFAKLASWFEVWSEDKRVLFRHWPVPASEIKQELPAPLESTLRFQRAQLTVSGGTPSPKK